jgi:trimeric autotransporter adhesin
MKFKSLLFSLVISVISFAQVPTITSFAPASGSVGTSVTITGTNFSSTLANNIVFVGSAKANVTSSNPTTLTVTLPVFASSNCKIQVIVLGTNNLSVLSKNDFIYTYSGGVSSNGNIYDQFDNNVVTEGVGPNLSGEGSSWPGYGSRIVSADFDYDGDMDLVAMGTSTSTAAKIFKNTNPTGNFTSSNFSISDLTLNNAGTSLTIHPADLDNDGKQDFVIGGTGNLIILRNTSTSSSISFAQQTITTAGINYGRIKPLDVDNDGYLDLVVAGNQSSVSVVKLTWSGTTPSGSVTTVSLPSIIRGLCFSDVNLDGKLDLVYQIRPTTFTIGYILNNSTSGNVILGSPTEIETNIPQGSYSSVAGDMTSADYDQDGDLDIVYATSGGATSLIWIKSQTGNLTYGASTSIGNMTSGIPSGLRSVDLNGDGKLDILITGGSNGAPTKGILNKHLSGSITSSSFHTVTYISNGMWGAAFEDFNNDGLIDVIHNDYYNANIAFIPNTLPTPPSVTISGNPSNTSQSICSGSNASTLSITAENATNYQWQVSFNSGAYSNISGATSSSFTPTALTTGTYQYKCIASNSGSTLTSNASGLITVNANPTLTTNLTTTLSQYCYSNPNTVNGVTVATSASSPSYQWQISSDNVSFSNVVNGTNPTAATYFPSHVDVWYGGTKYYKCIVTSNGCSTTSNSKPYGVYASLTQGTIPSITNENYCLNATPNNLVMQYTGDNNLVYQWSWGSASNGPWNPISGATATTYTPPTNISNTRYYRCSVSGTCSNTAKVSGAITVTDTYTWTGTTSTDPSVATNWNPAFVPCSGANEIIPTGLTNYPSYTSLTIATGTTMTVQSGARLTVTGVLTNNGTLTIESGATFLQGTSLAGTGIYNVKQTVTGTNDGTNPTGRFWYMGVPINNLTRSTAFGTAGTQNRLWSWSESGQAWSSQLGNTEALTPTTGYSFRTGSNTTLNFSGTSLYSADPSISGLTNTTGSFSGCHLMSNPFTAYADWEQIYTASANISSTYCVRSFNTGNSQMVYDTYNATGDVAVSNSTIAVTRYIAPMQSFWIIVNSSTTGTFNMTKAMLSHQPSATGLKDLSTFNAFARLNLIGGNLSDQVVVYMTPDATNGMDAYDSKKMMLSNVPQVYTTLGNDKLVINGLKESKAHTIVPLTLQLPTSQTYHFEMAESNVNYGLVILEDREELVFQDMTANPDYAFFAQGGISSDRFVLHFHFPLNTASTEEIGSSAQIDIVSNNTGAVNVHLSDDLQVGGEITVLDQSGRLVAKKTITQAQTFVQINETAGVYFVRVQTPGKTEMKKVVLY